MVSTSNERSLRIRTGPHDYGPREWCVFFTALAACRASLSAAPSLWPRTREKWQKGAVQRAFVSFMRYVVPNRERNLT